MKLVPASENGVFSFKADDADREIIFVKGNAVIADLEEGHCSNHTYHSNGCDDCMIAALFTVTEKASDWLYKAARTDIHPLEIKPGQPGPKLQLIRSQMTRKVFVFLTNAKSKVVKALRKEAKEFKNDTIEDADALFNTVFSSIEWDDLSTDVVSDLLAAGNDGASDGFNQLNVKAEHEDDIDSIASKYATYRAVEMIGKKWSKGDAGTLVDNPDAKFVISDTTKDDLHDIIHRAAGSNTSILALEALIVAAGIFSLARAELIAKTEIALAQANAHLDAWKKVGKIKLVNVVLSHAHLGPDLCDFISEEGPYTLESLPLIPVHPNCGCSIEVVEVEE